MSLSRRARLRPANSRAAAHKTPAAPREMVGCSMHDGFPSAPAKPPRTRAAQSRLTSHFLSRRARLRPANSPPPRKKLRPSVHKTARVARKPCCDNPRQSIQPRPGARKTLQVCTTRAGAQNPAPARVKSHPSKIPRRTAQTPAAHKPRPAQDARQRLPAT